MPIASNSSDKEATRRKYAKASSNDRLKKVLELCNGDKNKVAENLGVSYGHIHDVITGRSECSKLLDVACEAILRRFQQEKGQLKSMFVLSMNDTQSAVIIPLLTALNQKVGLELDMYTVNADKFNVVVFSCDYVHNATLTKIVESLKIKHYVFQQ